MITIVQAIKSAASTGSISLERVLKVAQHFDNEREQTKVLLRECEQNVGLFVGEKINQHLADMDGKFFNPIDYHYERPVGEQ